MATQGNRKRKKERKEYFFDYSLLFIVLFLLGFGLVMIYSASSYEASIEYSDAAYFLKKQILSVGLGLVVMFAVTLIPYRIWERFALIGYIFSICIIPVVLSKTFGHESHHARRWIKIPGIGITFQPAEIAKFAIILVLAVMICKMGNKNIRSWKGIGVLVAIPIPIALELLLITKNLSSAFIIMAIAVIMVFVASPDYKKFILCGLGAVAAVGALLLIVINGSGNGGFRSERVLAWLDPEAHSQGTGFQTLQALYAIGSGGIRGKGLGESMQKLNYLPEAQNDMIFSIICEELGLFGAISVILLFIMLIWRMVVIANNASDLFGAMLVVGVMGQIAVQAILNIAVVTNTIPNTGVSLPFISYGGTSVIFLLAEIGLVLNVGRGIEMKDMYRKKNMEEQENIE